MTSTNVDNIKFPLPLSKNGFLYGFAESALGVKLHLCIFFKEVNSSPSFSLPLPSLTSDFLLFFPTGFAACVAKTLQN